MQQDMYDRQLQEKIEFFRKEMGYSSDLSVRECIIGSNEVSAAVIWISGMTDSQLLNENVMAPLLHQTQEAGVFETAEELYEWLNSSIISAVVSYTASLGEAVSLLLSGQTIVIADGFSGAVAVGTQGYETRSIEEPASTVVVRGPRDGFVESLEVNISLIRRRIRNKKLRVESLMIGTATHTSIAMVFLQDRAPDTMVGEVRERLRQIDIDAVLESQYIEEMIRDSPVSFFPTVFSTERPDDVAGGILDGRVAIIVDGTPFVLLVPCTFFHLMKFSEDYYQSYAVSTFIRWLRFIGFFITLLFPSVYVGVLMFHPEIVPPQLLSSILSSREGVPFPLLVEALLMELTFEGLREAGVRMPRAIGSAISIVGALVIGDSAVKAGIISSPTIIVVAGTAIASFTIPSTELSGAVRLLRFFMLICASLLGLYGVFIGLLLLGIHLTTMRSFGMSYLAPLAPYSRDEAVKAVTRVPRWAFWSKWRGHR